MNNNEPESTVNRDAPAERQKAKNPLKDILIIFGIPTAVIVLALAVLYIPRAFANPQYDFIYTVCSRYDCDDSYTIENKKIVKKNTGSKEFAEPYSDLDRSRVNVYKPTVERESYPDLYYFSIADNDARRIDFEEAQKYTLDSSLASPDGYRLEKDTYRGSFGDYRSSSPWVLSKGLASKEVTLDSVRSYSEGSVDVMGWVEK